MAEGLQKRLQNEVDKYKAIQKGAYVLVILIILHLL